MRTIKQADVHKLLYLVFLKFLLTGCASPAVYREPITRFQLASTVVIEGVRTDYGATNKRERDAVIDRMVNNRERINLEILKNKEIRSIFLI